MDILGQYSFRQLHATELILCRHLALAAFPRMEFVGVEFLLRLFVASRLVEQCDPFEHEVVALRDELRVLLQECQSLPVGVVQLLAQLVEFHEHAGIGLVECKGAFHHRECLLLLPQFIVCGKGEVSPHRWELRVELRRQLPVVHRRGILPLVVIEAAQIVRSLGTLGVYLLGQ